MPIARREFLSALGAGWMVGVSGCLQGSQEDDAQPGVVGETLTLTTTTSTYDTGLLDELNAEFEAMYGVSVDGLRSKLRETVTLMSLWFTPAHWKMTSLLKGMVSIDGI